MEGPYVALVTAECQVSSACSDVTWVARAAFCDDLSYGAGTETVLESKVTAAIRASARPSSTAPVLRLID